MESPVEEKICKQCQRKIDSSDGSGYQTINWEHVIDTFQELFGGEYLIYDDNCPNQMVSLFRKWYVCKMDEINTSIKSFEQMSYNLSTKIDNLLHILNSKKE